MSVLFAVLVGSATARAAPCPDGARLRLHCPVEGGKQVSVCEEGQQLVYRFGKAGAEQPELELKKATLSHRRTGPDSERHVVSFWNAGHRYAVAVDRTEDQFEARVVVRKGAKALATLHCTAPISVDFTETSGRFGSNSVQPTSWLGEWTQGEEASLRIVENDGQLVVEEGFAVYHMSETNVHTGEVQGPLQDDKPGVKLVKEHECELKLRWAGPDHLVADDNLKCGGLNVRFMGDFWREP